MSRRCVGYEGEGRARRPIYEDQGPASGRGRASTPGGHAEVARIAHAEASKLIEVGGRMPSGGASAIERRMATEAQRAHWRSPPAEDSPIAPVPISEAARRLAAAHRGGAVNRVKTTTGLDLREARAIVDRDPLITLADSPVTPVTPVTPEEPVMAIAAPPPGRLERLRAIHIAALEAAEALEEYTAARERHEAAERALGDAVGALLELVPAPTPTDQLRTLLAERDRLTATRNRVALDEAALGEERQAALEDVAVAAALRDDRLGEPHYHDAPEVATPRPAAAGGGPGKSLSHQQARVLASALKHGGDFKAIADEVGCTRQNARLALDAVGKKGQLPIDLIPRLPAGFAKYSGV